MDKEEAVLVDYEGEGVTILKGLKFGHTAVDININIKQMMKYFLAKNSTQIEDTEDHFSNLG